MDKEVFDFYEDKGLVIARIVSKRPFGLSQHQVMEALALCHEKIKAGKHVPDIELARYVWNVAGGINDAEFDGQRRKIKSMKDLNRKQSMIMTSQAESLGIMDGRLKKYKRWLIMACVVATPALSYLGYDKYGRIAEWILKYMRMLSL